LLSSALFHKKDNKQKIIKIIKLIVKYFMSLSCLVKRVFILRNKTIDRIAADILTVWAENAKLNAYVIIK